MAVVDTLPRQVAEKLKIEFLTLEGMGQQPLRSWDAGQKIHKRDLVQIFASGLPGFLIVGARAHRPKTQGDIGPVAAPGRGRKTCAIGFVGMVQHETDPHAAEWIDDLGEYRPQHVEKSGRLAAGSGLAIREVTIGAQIGTVAANRALYRGAKVWPPIQHEHHQRLATGGTGGLEVNVRVVSFSGECHAGQGSAQQRR